MIISPLGRPGRHLKERRASAEQKNWVCDEINAGNETPSSVGKKYCLKIKTIQRWQRHIGNGKVLCDKAGHPPLLDEKNLSLSRIKCPRQLIRKHLKIFQIS